MVAWQDRRYRTAIGLVGAVAVGTAFAHAKLNLLAGALFEKLCALDDTCAPGAPRETDLGFFAWANMPGYVYYPASLALALFVPRRAWPLALAAAAAVLMPLGMALDLLGFGLVVFMTMFVAMVALPDVLAISFGAAALHSALVLLVLGRLARPADPDIRPPKSS